jgi:TRAP-type C4-dicarboxylate transport system substrate-binding protein
MRILRTVLSVLSVASAAILPMAAHAQQPIVIKYSSYHPATIWFTSKGINPWIAEVEKVTQGRVKIETLPKTVGTPAGAFDVTRDGLADMAIVITGYTPGRFPLAEMGELPFGGDDASTMSPAFDRVYRKHFAKADEFKGVEILSIFTISPGHIFTAKRPVKTMDDIKGLKLRSPGATASRALTLMGAVPILKSFTEAQELLSTGAIDGSLLLKETVLSGNALGLLHHGTIIPGGVFNAVLAIAVNADKWKSIPEADRKAIMSISGEKFARHIGTAYSQADRDAVAAMTDAKFVVEPASPALVQNLKKALSPLEAEWIDRAKKKGIADPAAVLNEFRQDAAKPWVASN